MTVSISGLLSLFVVKHLVAPVAPLRTQKSQWPLGNLKKWLELEDCVFFCLITGQTPTPLSLGESAWRIRLVGCGEHEIIKP